MSHKFQDKLVDQVVGNRRLVVAKYGAGKCRVTLEAAKLMLVPTCLIVITTPNRNMATWDREIPKWWSDTHHLLYGGHELDLEAIKPHRRSLISFQPFHIIVISHSTFTTRIDDIINLEPDLVVMDECTAIKNPTTKIAIAAHKLANSSTRMRLALTGHPTPENLYELWSQMQFIWGKLNPFGATYYKFLNRFFLKADFQWVLRQEKEKEFMDLFDKYTARMDEEDVEEHAALVGAKTQNAVMYYSASDTQLKLMHELKSTWSLPVENLGPDMVGEEGKVREEYWHTMSILHKSQQIAGGFYYSGSRPVVLRENPKLERLRQAIETLHNLGHKRIVVWHHYEFEQSMLVGSLSRMSAGVVALSEPNIDEFRESTSTDCLVMVINLSRAKGINDLISAAVAIWYSNTFSQEARDQAEARLPRPGQKSPTVTNIDICCKELADSRVVEALQAKAFTPERAAGILTATLENLPPLEKGKAQ